MTLKRWYTLVSVVAGGEHVLSRLHQVRRERERGREGEGGREEEREREKMILWNVLVIG